MSFPISVLQVSASPQEEEQLKSARYIQVPGNLNKGTTGPDMFLWYKRGSINPITRIQFSFTPGMDQGLADAGFTMVDKDLNNGTKGDPIYLWYMSGTTEFDTSITELTVTTCVTDEPDFFTTEWERLGCDLNRGTTGDPVYLWVKRTEPTYVADIKTSVKYSSDKENFNSGYFRVDEDTNRGANPSVPVFLWYRHSKNKDSAVNEIDISLCEAEEQDLQLRGFTKVSRNLNEGTTGNPVYLWYKRGRSSTLRSFTVLVKDSAVKAYTNAGCNVVNKNLNDGNRGDLLQIAYN